MNLGLQTLTIINKKNKKRIEYSRERIIGVKFRLTDMSTEGRKKKKTERFVRKNKKREMKRK